MISEIITYKLRPGMTRAEVERLLGAPTWSKDLVTHAGDLREVGVGRASGEQAKPVRCIARLRITVADPGALARTSAKTARLKQSSNDNDAPQSQTTRVS